MSTQRNRVLELALEHADWVRGLAARLVGDVARADDVVQDALIQAYLHPPTDESSPRGWIATVVRNVARQRIRGEATRARHERAEPITDARAPSAAELVAEVETTRRVARLATELAEPYREAVLLRYYEGLSSAEIARRLRVPAGTVRWRLKEGLDRLRVRLDLEFEGDRAAWCRALVPIAGRDALIRGLGTGLLLKGALSVKLIQGTLGAAAVVAVGLVMWASMGEATPDRATESAAAAAAEPRLSGGSDETVERRELEPGAPAEPRAPESAHAAAREPAAVPPDRAAVTARVVDTDGRPIEGATITLTVLPIHRATTDADGRAMLSGTVPSAFRDQLDQAAPFRVEHPSFSTEFTAARLALGTTIDLGDVLLRPAGTVGGRVTDVAGKAIAGAEVVVLAPDAVPLMEEPTGPFVSHDARLVTTTASDGSYRLDGVRAGFVRLAADSRRHERAVRDDVEVAAGAFVPDVDFVLERSETSTEPDRITGVVLDPDGRPVPGARVEARAISVMEHGAQVTRVSTAKADEDGCFSFLAGVDGPPRRLIARDSERRFREAIAADVEPGASDVTLRLGIGRFLAVAARDPAGRAVDAFRVQALDPTADEPRGDAPVDAAGGEARVPVPTTSFRLEVEADGYHRLVLGPFDPDRTPERTVVTLARMVGLCGVVVRAGVPVGGARVTAHAVTGGGSTVDGFPVRSNPTDEAEARSGAGGRFALSVRRAGRFYVRATDADGAAGEVGPFEYDPEIGVLDVVVAIVAGGAIEGHVLTSAFRSAAGVVVGISRGDGFERSVRVAKDGVYRFDGLLPGAYWVRTCQDVVDPKTIRTFTSLPGDAPPELPANCEVFDGRSTHFDLDLTRCRLSGHLAIEGRDIAGAVASLRPTGGLFRRFAVPVETTVGADGRFTLDLGDEGTARLAIRLTDGLELAEDIQLQRGDQSWLRSLASGSVRVEGAGGGRLHLVGEARSVRYLVPASPAADGAEALVAVPTGSARLVRFTGAIGIGEDADTIVDGIHVRTEETTVVEAGEDG